MEKILVENNLIDLIYHILMQIGGPCKFDYGAYQYTDLNEKLINLIRIKVKNSYMNKESMVLNGYELFYLIRILDFVINNLGINEFDTVVGYSISDGLKLLSNLRNKLRSI